MSRGVGVRKSVKMSKSDANDSEEEFEEILKKAGISEKEIYKIQREVISQIIVDNDLDDLYLKNENAALKKSQKLWKEAYESKNTDILVVKNFLRDKNLLISFIKKYEKELNEISEMFLIEAVSIFETMINHHFETELKLNYKLSREKVEHILVKLNTEDKLSWLLIMISGKNFTKSKYWSIIKNGINARNFFIHYKPSLSKKYEKYLKMLEYDSITEFLSASTKCCEYLKKARSKVYQEYQNRIKKVQSLMDERFKTIKLVKSLASREKRGKL